MKRLSKPMRRAIEIARQEERLLRVQHKDCWGGWFQVRFEKRSGIDWFTTSTIDALVRRGLAEYTGWVRYKRPHGDVERPIEVRLNEY